MREEGQSRYCESKVLKEIARGDRTSYTALYDRYADMVYRFILPFVDFSTPDAEEIVQDIFLEIWIQRKRLAEVGNFRSYVFQMAKNRAFELFRKQKRMLKLGREVCINPQTESSYHELVFREYNEAAQQIIERLTPQRKRIFEMRTQMDMELDEIAGILEISKSGVKKQLYEAVSFVKKQMKNEHDVILSYLVLVSFVTLILKS